MYYNQNMNTIQDIYLSFFLKEGKTINLSAEEADTLNENITNIIDENITGNENPIYIEEGGFNINGCTISDDEVEFNFRADVTIYGKTYYSPGRMYMPNGDPGYPDECEWEPLDGWIESIDKEAIVTKLLNLPKLGELIDKSTIKLELYDFDDDGELEDPDF